jgi:hypothetical protein
MSDYDEVEYNLKDISGIKMPESEKNVLMKFECETIRKDFEYCNKSPEIPRYVFFTCHKYLY